MKNRLDELHMNTIGKIFFASLGAWLVGKTTNVKIRGSKQEIDAIVDAMASSKRFQDELSRPGATVDSVIEKLKLKNASAREFQTILGVPWPL